MNILVTGANGQLGNEMQICSRSSNDTYFFTDVCEGYEHLDITVLQAVKEYVRQNNIHAIVNCAAWTNVDGAEDPAKYDLVESLNATAPENLAIAMKEVGGLLVHISTDYVFGKEPYNTPCKEDQTGTPTGVYGLTKLHGEQKIQATGCNYVIIRTAWLYSEFGKNFCKTMLNLTATKPELKVVFDQVGTPTYATDLAEAIMHLVNKGIKGCEVYHYTNDGVASWFDFTKLIFKLAGCKARLHAIESYEYPTPAERPAYSVLSKRKIAEAGAAVPYWTESLEKCMKILLAK